MPAPDKKLEIFIQNLFLGQIAFDIISVYTGKAYHCKAYEWRHMETPVIILYYSNWYLALPTQI